MAGPPLTTDERAAGLNAVTYAFLGSSPLNETLDVSVDQHPELNVQLTKTRRGLRMIVAQKKEGSPRVAMAGESERELAALGFSGGGRKGNYRSFETPTEPEALAHRIERVMVVAFRLGADWEPVFHTANPEVQEAALQAIVSITATSHARQRQLVPTILPQIPVTPSPIAGSAQLPPGNGSFKRPGRRKIWITRIVWLLLISWCAAMVFLNPWLLMVPGTLAAVLALLMPTLGVSFDDLLGRPEVRGGKVTFHPSGIRIAFVVILFSVLAGPYAVMLVMRGLGPVLGWILTAIASALVIAGTVSYWRRRAIVVDAHRVYLQGLVAMLATQCDRARVDRITVDYGNIAGYGLTRGLVGQGAMTLRSADGAALLTIPLEFFTTRDGIKLAHLLAVPIVTGDGNHVSGMR